MNNLDELWEHRGDIIEIDGHEGVADVFLRRKLRGVYHLPSSWEERSYYEQHNYLIWGLRSSRTHGDFTFRTLREGHSLAEMLEDARGPEERKDMERKWKKDLIPLSKIRIVECYHEPES